MKPCTYNQTIRLSVACFGLLTSAVPLCAQAVIASPPGVYSPASAQEAQSKNPPGKRLSNMASAMGAGAPLIQRGPFVLRPHILYRILYSDGLLNADQAESGNSIIQTVSVGTALGLGKRWVFDYTLTKNYSSNRFIADSTDHAFSLGGGVSYGDLQLGVSQTYNSNAPTLVETGTQTKQQSYATTAHASLPLGSRTVTGFSISRSTRLANAPARSPEWTTSDWRSLSATGSIGYFVSPRLQASFVYTAGRDYVSRGSDMSHSQPQGQLSWRPTNKLSLSANAGIEQRRFLAGSKETLNTPLYAVNGHYQPTQTTGFSVGANRSLSASYFANQATQSTSVSFGYEQRILGKYFWTTDLSRFETKYIATVAGAATGRVDKGSIVGTRIATVLFGRVSLSVFYQVGHTTSSRLGFGFTSHQVGSEIGYRF